MTRTLQPSRPGFAPASAPPSRHRGRATGAAVLPALLFMAVLVTLPSAGPTTTYLRTIAGQHVVSAAQPTQGQLAQGEPSQGQPSQGQPADSVPAAKTATTGPVQRVEQQVTFHVPAGLVRAGVVAYVVLVLAGLGLAGGFLLRRRAAGDTPLALPRRSLRTSGATSRPPYPVASPAASRVTGSAPPPAWGLSTSPTSGDSAQ